MDKERKKDRKVMPEESAGAKQSFRVPSPLAALRIIFWSDTALSYGWPAHRTQFGIVSKP